MSGDFRSDPSAVILDPERLQALHRARLLDTPGEAAFDRLARLATLTLDVPVALVSLVDEDRQFFKSCVGLAEPWAGERETPLSHSLCQFAVATDRPLVIDDAHVHPDLAENGAVTELGVVAYAGVPIRSRSGHALGSFCVIDDRARVWTDAELTVVEELAALTSELIELRLGALVASDSQALVGQLVAAQESERARIAAEVHDDSLQVITAVSIRLQLLQRRVEPALVPEIETLASTVLEASDRLRSLLFELRPSALDNADLRSALVDYLGQTFGAGGPRWSMIDHDLRNEPSAEGRFVFFRIAQEALANIQAHAGAGSVTVTLASEGRGVALTIDDDGGGFDPDGPIPPGHLGLTTMRERAHLAGGDLRIDSRPGEGTTVRAWLPVGVA